MKAANDALVTPRVSVIVGGEQLQAVGGQCDRKKAEAAGYGWILEAEVTIGTTFPFIAEIFIPTTNTAEIEAVVVGDPSTSEALDYQPTIIPELPPAK